MISSVAVNNKAITRLPAICWHLGRAGALHHLGRITILPVWLRRILTILDKAITFGRIETDAGVALCNALQRLGTWLYQIRSGAVYKSRFNRP